MTADHRSGAAGPAGGTTTVGRPGAGTNGAGRQGAGAGTGRQGAGAGQQGAGAGRSGAGLRSDAARNRQALIQAARTVFHDRGLDAPLDDIARHAGTGNATLYRHFPTRCALVTAVFADALVDVVAVCDRAFTNPDPWDGFADYVRFLCQLQADDRGMADLLTTSIVGAPDLEKVRRRAVDGLGRLVDRAQQAGSLRPDFRQEDIGVFLMANAGLIHRTADKAPTAWKRMATYFLDGLHLDGPVTDLPPSPGPKAVRAAMAARGAHFGCC